MKRFLKRTTFLTAILFLAGYIIYTQFIPKLYNSILPFILIFFYFLTNLVHFYLLRIAGKNMRKFTAHFMATNFIKMFIYLIFAIVFVWFHREHAKVFLANFLIIYIAFSVMEVYEITRVVRQKK